MPFLVVFILSPSVGIGKPGFSEMTDVCVHNLNTMLPFRHFMPKIDHFSVNDKCTVSNSVK